MKKLLKSTLLGLSLFGFAFAGTEVNQIVCGENVENREIVNPSDNLPNNLEKIYCLSAIKTDEAPTTIYHIWYYNGKEIAKVELPVKLNSPNYRVWSSKKLLPSWTGDWKLSVLDKDGNVLAEKEFKVIKSEENNSNSVEENNNSKEENSNNNE